MTSYLKCHVCKHYKDGCLFGHKKDFKNFNQLWKHVSNCKHIDCKVPPGLIIDSFKISIEDLKKK